MRRVVLGSVIALSLLAIGCAPTSPIGSFYSDTKVPMQATENPTGDKTGKACKQTILGAPTGGFLTFGDASLQTAAQDGGIKKVSSVSSEWTTIWFLYAKNCTVVNGQ